MTRASLSLLPSLPFSLHSHTDCCSLTDWIFKLNFCLTTYAILQVAPQNAECRNVTISDVTEQSLHGCLQVLSICQLAQETPARSGALFLLTLTNGDKKDRLIPQSACGSCTVLLSSKFLLFAQLASTRKCYTCNKNGLFVI